MLILNKILPLLVLPPGICLILVVMGLVLRRRLLIWMGVLVLWVLSMPIVGDSLMRHVEGSGGRLAVGSVRPADAVVVLSGMIEEVPGAPLGEWGEAVDRFEGGIDLFRAGKAPLLIFTAGQMPWDREAVPEGVLLEKRAILLGVPERNIRLTPIAGNTDEEAAGAAKLLGVAKGDRKRIILVTSAFHMHRALMLFQRAGFDLQPYPVDFRAGRKRPLIVLDFLPAEDGLRQSSIALREMIGWGFYWARGVVLR